jgi:succinate dehydrogenase/fumarate reductase flavoprotein subunit
MTQYIGPARPGPGKNVAYTGTAGATSAIGAQTYKVRVLVTTDAFVTTDGSTPSSTSGAYVPANSPECFTTSPGQIVKAVQVASGGTLYVAEML